MRFVYIFRFKPTHRDMYLYLDSMKKGVILFAAVAANLIHCSSKFDKKISQKELDAVIIYGGIFYHKNTEI